MARSRTPKKPKLLDSPLAITTDGQVVANVTHALVDLHLCDDPQVLVAKALATGRQVFLGVVMTDDEVRDAKERIDDAAAEVVARVAEA